MKLFSKKKSGAVAALEGEIDALEKRREALQGKLDTAANALEVARIERNGFLIDGPEDDVAGLRSIDDRITAAEHDVIGLRDAIDAIDSRLVDARQRLELEREGDERERRAASLERAANEISAKAVALEKATDALAIAFGEFVAAIPNDLIIHKVGHGGHPVAATPLELASAVVAQGLLMSSGILFEPRKLADGVLRPLGAERALVVRIVDVHGRLVSFLPGANGADAEILPTSIAAEEIIVRQLRAQAERLRASDELRAAAE